MLALHQKISIKKELRGDAVIWLVVSLLAAFSLMAVYSSSTILEYHVQGSSTEYFLFKQLLHLGFGIFLAFAIHLLDYRRFLGVAKYVLYLAVPLLLLTMAIGPEINDARRWLEVPGLGITIQASDFAKLALILYVARVITKKQDHIKDLRSAFVPIILPVLIVCACIAPSDLSNAMLLFTTCLVMMFIGRIHIQYIAVFILLGIVLLAGIIAIGEMLPGSTRVDTWASRIDEFVNTDGGYQIEQAKIAIAGGGWFGLGPGQSDQINFLPYSYSDFIYAIICEEYGIIGGIIIILLYLTLLFRCIRIVTKNQRTFASLLALGLGISLVLQAFICIGVAVQLLPATGLTLPMVSMGGTSILFTCIALGIILSISRTVEQSQDIEPKTVRHG